MIIRIIEAYTTLIPHPVIISLIENGKITFETLDVDMVTQAIKKGITSIDAAEGINSSAAFLKNNNGLIQKVVGKHLGKKIATQVAVIIAIQIAKRMAITISVNPQYKRFLRYRPADKTTKGLAGVVVSLLKLQGTLQICSNSSLRLQAKCPKLWSELRSSGRGLDLLYFLVEDYLSEYVDRISLAEKNPRQFIEMVNALIRANNDAHDIFFPFSNVRSKPVKPG